MLPDIFSLNVFFAKKKKLYEVIIAILDFTTEKQQGLPWWSRGVAKTPSSRAEGAQVPLPVRELDPTCHS